MNKFNALFKKLTEDVSPVEIVPALEDLGAVVSSARAWHQDFVSQFNPEVYEASLDATKKKKPEELLVIEKMKANWSKVEPIAIDVEKSIVAMEQTFAKLQELYDAGLFVSKAKSTEEATAE